MGFFPLLSPAGAPVGTIRVESKTAATITMTVATGEDMALHPWGIYDQPGCTMPTPDLDSPFQFADIEGGTHTEEIEADSYLAFPRNLVALVFSTDGSAIYGCASLGTQAKTATSPTAPPSCSMKVPGPPGRGEHELAMSRDVLSDSEIFLIHDDGSLAQRLTSSLGVDMKPSWSPDGEQIAFRSQRDGNDEIYVMNADGSCPHNVTSDPVDDRSPAWSPDGRLIAFDHFFRPALQDIAVINIDGSGRRQVTTASGEYPTWSPDGTRLAFASARDGDYELYVVNADGSHETRLTDNQLYDMYPAWSPDGKWLAFERGVNGFDAAMEIHLMHPDGTDDRRVTSNDRTDRFPAWSLAGQLAWSQNGSIMVATSPDATPIGIGNGQFPAWRP
jgi:Tol biopolymer transport system component